MLIFIICSDLYGRKDKKEKQWKASYMWVDELCVFACVCVHTHTYSMLACGTVLYMRNCQPWLKAGISGKLSKACVRKDL